MTDHDDQRTGQERYEAGAERAREYFRRNGLVAAPPVAGARTLSDVLPKGEAR